LRSGDIVAAGIQKPRCEVFQAVKYDDGNFYQRPDGKKALRKSFLRAPVSFKYISLVFKKNGRFHPVQKTMKKHTRSKIMLRKVGTP